MDKKANPLGHRWDALRKRRQHRRVIPCCVLRAAAARVAAVYTPRTSKLRAGERSYLHGRERVLHATMFKGHERQLEIVRFVREGLKKSPRKRVSSSTVDNLSASAVAARHRCA